MIFWPLVAVYSLGWIQFWRVLARFWIEGDEDDWATAIGFATFLAWFWPVVFVGWVFCRIGGPSAAKWFILGSRHKAVDLSKRIEELEREVGIK